MLTKVLQVICNDDIPKKHHNCETAFIQQFRRVKVDIEHLLTQYSQLLCVFAPPTEIKSTT